MIASLKGKITAVFKNFVIVETIDGVGYKVEGLPLVNQIEGLDVSIYVFTHYTQQDVRLFGFTDRKSYLLFNDLIGVSGVGPKSAVSLLNNIGVDEIKMAVNSQDHKSLMGNGIGTKIAQKIVIELAGKYEHEKLDVSLNPAGQKHELQTDIEMALEGLGYSRKEVSEAVLELDLKTEPDDNISFEKSFRKALAILQKQHKQKVIT